MEIKLGNGCTSGHGICGLARLNKRSLVAVLSFMTTGILSASTCAKYLRTSTEDVKNISDQLHMKASLIIGLLLAIYHYFPRVQTNEESVTSRKQSDNDEKFDHNRKIIGAALSASLFAFGLAFGQMTKSSKVNGFLDFQGFRNGTYDPTLVTVMGGGFLISFSSYQFVPGFSIFKVSYDLYIVSLITC